MERIVSRTSPNECGCRQEARLYRVVDWQKRPARFYWLCTRCHAVGVSLLDHAGVSGFYGQPPRALQDGDNLEAVWSACDAAMSHRSADWRFDQSISVSRHELEGALARWSVRISGEVRDAKRQSESLLKEAREQWSLSRRMFWELRDRLLAWHRVRLRRVGWPEPSMQVLCDGTDPVAVYALVDPRSPEEVRYVGITENPRSRYRDHCKSKEWALDLAQVGVRPMMLLIEWAPTTEDARDREAHWINHYRELGMADLNNALPRAVAA